MLMSDRGFRSRVFGPPCPGSVQRDASGPVRPGRSCSCRPHGPAPRHWAHAPRSAAAGSAPHHLLHRHSRRPRRIALRRQSVPRRLSISYRLSTALIRPLPPRTCLVSALCSCLSPDVLCIVSTAGTVREQFHRQQQSDRRPTHHQHRLPRQRRRRRHIRRQRHRDTEQERQPHHGPRPAAPTPIRGQQSDRRQQQQPVNREGPQRRAHRIRPALQGKRPLMNVRGVSSHRRHHQRAAPPHPHLKPDTGTPGV